ncbi:MAG: histidinol dehydrogenase [Coriobacteriales bacterium]|jgi:histidinol dehydrogenase|nr:histidinol dehydrogenase [Coriobacteriales bacterium]
MRIEYLEEGERPSAEMLGRAVALESEILGNVATIIAAVQARGDDALKEYTKQFDGVDITLFRVDELEPQRALRKVSPTLLAALQTAAKRITEFHEHQRQQSWFTTREDGSFIGSKVTPVGSAGIYVPGGRAQYPSTVLMNAIPAQVAGVQRIVMVSPPQANGRISDVTLAAAQLAGVTEIYMVGGAQAIAALAYGTDQILPVDKITGPGNAYVSAAKRLVSGDVGIDMIAGPSEVLILADETADSGFIAIDLLAQAEHDPDARTYLVTTDEDLVDEVIEEIEKLLALSPRLETTKQAIDNNCTVFVCPDLATALLASNTVAPEHLEIQMDQPFELLGLIENAGAIFIGPWTPESVGDYVAGPNHTLPTSGAARYRGPLSVDDFIKRSSVISYSYGALDKDAATIKAFAEAEGLWAHGRAVELRFETPEPRDEDDDAEKAEQTLAADVGKGVAGGTADAVIGMLP